MSWQYDEWLAEVIAFPCYRWEKSETSNKYDLDIPVERGFYSIKSDLKQIDRINALEDIGFRLADIHIHIKWQRKIAPLSLSEKNVKDWNIRLATSMDFESMKAIAIEAFQNSRFHRNKAINSSKADDIWSKWVDHSLRGIKKTKVYVLEHGKFVGGFLSYKASIQGNIEIDLLALNKSLRGQGLAAYLIESVLIMDPTVDEILCETEATNMKALNLYARLGFRFMFTSGIFHFNKL
jgi:ribosomal protein S18 acetylase RimI-like enzyme